MRSPLALPLLVFAVALLPTAASHTEITGGPRQVVESLHAVLIDAMQQSESLSYQGRVELIAPIVASCVDQLFMAQKSIGRHWKKLTPEEQQTWLRTFSELSVANYAGRFTGYSGETFEIETVEDAPHDTKLVKTTLRLPKDDDVLLNYRLHETNGRWKIIDIYMDGTVSELSLRRSEYASTLKRSGFKALVEALRGKIENLAESGGRQYAAPSQSGETPNP